MASKTKQTAAVVAGTKLPPELAREAKEVTQRAGINMAQLLRIGLTRVLDDVRKNNGVLILGAKR